MYYPASYSTDLHDENDDWAVVDCTDGSFKPSSELDFAAKLIIAPVVNEEEVAVVAVDSDIGALLPNDRCAQAQTALEVQLGNGYASECGEFRDKSYSRKS